MATTIQGNDISGSPQGAMLGLLLAEMRIQTTLLQAIACGQLVTPDNIASFRVDSFIEPVVTVTPN